MNEIQEKPLISVIVPIYNVEQYLCKCIDSIISQTYTNLEIILIDDGSPDNCGDICDQYALKDDRIIVIHQKNGGLSAARNSGIDICKGEYISFVDSDDFVSPFFIEMMYCGLKKFDCEISSLERRMQFIDGQDETVTFEKNAEDYIVEEIIPKEAIRRMMYQQLPNGVQWRLYKKEIFSEIRFPVGWLYEDAATTHKTFMKCKKIALIHADIYAYRLRQNSIIRMKFTSKKLISITIGEQIVKEIREYDEDLYDAACSRAFAINYHVFLQIPLNQPNNLKQVWKIVKRYRKTVVKDKCQLMRKKNKIGAYISYLGLYPAHIVGTLFKKIG